MSGRKAMDQLLEAIYRLREEGASRQQVMEAVERINRQYDEDLASLQMLQDELGHAMPLSEGGEAPRVSLQRPDRPRS